MERGEAEVGVGPEGGMERQGGRGRASRGVGGRKEDRRRGRDTHETQSRERTEWEADGQGRPGAQGDKNKERHREKGRRAQRRQKQRQSDRGQVGTGRREGEGPERQRGTAQVGEEESAEAQDAAAQAAPPAPTSPASTLTPLGALAVSHSCPLAWDISAKAREGGTAPPGPSGP